RRAESWLGDEELALRDVVLRPEAREVRVGGEPVELTSIEFDLLAILLGNPDRVLTREVLLDRVWGLAFPGGTRTVDVHVASLRRKLARPDIVRTVRGAGYRAGRD
ncbi:MAG: winged helix-turn-helix domain-containing protein, partial [Gaiellaceae bacterium]